MLVLLSCDSPSSSRRCCTQQRGWQHVLASSRWRCVHTQEWHHLDSEFFMDCDSFPADDVLMSGTYLGGIYASECSLFLSLRCLCGFLNTSHLFLLLSYCLLLGRMLHTLSLLCFLTVLACWVGFNLQKVRLCCRGGSWSCKTLRQILLATAIVRHFCMF